MALLTEAEVDRRLPGGWRREGDAIRRTVRLKDFVTAVEYVNRLVAPAEEMNHHPDLELSWNTVTVSLTTHSEGGITERDLELARRIDALGC